MNLRKTYFILPNLFTLASVFCGFFAITLCAADRPSIDLLYQAALAITFAFFFDLADGRVARLTRTQSNLGMELDSLADVISFGVAPALLVYKWGLQNIRVAGVFISFLYCAAAALRLARFNVLSLERGSEKPSKYILGLPVPAAASILVALVVLNHQMHGSYLHAAQASLALLLVVLSYLMVSRVRFRSFKDVRPSRRAVTAGVGVLAFFGVMWRLKMHSAFTYVILMGLYLVLGLSEEILFFRRRHEEENEARAPSSTALPSEGGARSDEEVLEELGAFDENTGEHKVPK